MLRVRVRLMPAWVTVYVLGRINHLGPDLLRLAIPLWVGAVSTSKRLGITGTRRDVLLCPWSALTVLATT